YLGVEEVDGTPAHKIRVALKDGDVQFAFLDPDACLEIRIVNERRERGSEQVTEADLGAFGLVDGAWLPTCIYQRRKGPPRTAPPASCRSSTSSRSSRSEPSPSIRGTRARCGSVPGRPGRATPSPSATASTSPPMRARPGRTWGWPNPSGSRGSWCIPKAPT